MAALFASAFLGVLSLAAQPGTADEPPRPRSTGAQPTRIDEQLLLEVNLNGKALAGAFLFVQRPEGYLIESDVLDACRIDHTSIDPVVIGTQEFIPLYRLKGVVAKLDGPSQRMMLSVPTERFATNHIAAARTAPKLTESALSAFLNYDAALQFGRKLTGTAAIEAGASDDWGAVDSTALLGTRGATRLDTYFLRDNPRQHTRLVIGDVLTDARDWSRQIRFGGIRFGTEFSTQPNFITFPTPDFAGRTSVPSSVEVLVNDARRYQTDVEPGPFTINQLPLVTGAGAVTLVVRDALGVEQRVTTSYYVSSRLLRPGLSDWSLEAGAERHNYGTSSFNYGDPFASGTYRRGITDFVTAEGRAEFGRDVQMAGGGVNFVWSPVGEFDLAMATSHSHLGTGYLYRAAFSRITPLWSIAVSYQHESRSYAELGSLRDQNRITGQLQASAGVSFGRWGNLGLAYAGLTYADHTRARVGSVNYNAAVGRHWYLGLYALNSRFTNLGSSTTVGFSLSAVLAGRSSALVQADNRNVGGEIQRTAPLDGGWGYRIAATHGQIDREEADLDWRGSPGELSFGAARTGQDTSVRLLAQGGLLLIGREIYPTRRADGGFALVEVPGQPNVRIYQENRLVAQTDREGRAIIPELRPYEENRIAIAPADLPLNSSMGSDTLFVVPRYRGTVRARFEVHTEEAGTVVLQMPDGSPVVPGTDVSVDGRETAFAGYGGEVFIHFLHAGAALVLETSRGICRARVDRVPQGEPLPRIGPVRCTMEEDRK